MRILEINKGLALRGVGTAIKYDLERDLHYLDLETQAKSDLHLFENGKIVGRYNYLSELNIHDLTMEDIVRCLCFEFKRALCGRDYGSVSWFNLCKNYGI